MRSHAFVPALLLLTACGVAGCSLFNSSHPDTPLIPAPKPYVADVPLPAGFSMTADSTSKVVPQNAIRFVDHHYKGSDDYLAVNKFYRDHMPENGWTWIDQTQPGGKEISLHFTKNNEDCVITIMRHTFNTEIHVRIDPIGHTTAK